ncbi:type VII secretion-associated serine protease mycosin [Micromonospora echinofusca]|uniref:Type VII secretion-associated serine protease mycosin n=1 Tax=Micromonospora echinofusca TaxID=47858 RepID=A0ABS3VSB8_MICEH|nr:type VII secretion-associated serine protease mycosin [Micromonospora echinofusca]MBO4207358.1 type VII secretion-associated serine protease mycosin [Micromonospora echinofusca]
MPRDARSGTAAPRTGPVVLRRGLTASLSAAVLSVISVVAPGPFGVPAVGRAPACPVATVTAEPVTGVPWPQTRYAPERLGTLATGAGVTVAVVDSGVDPRHPQLRGRVLDGVDLLDPGGDGTDDCAGHGTAVASIIAAGRRPDTSFTGLAPAARILPVRVSEQQVIEGRESGRTVRPEEFARAIRWAVDHGAQVLNLSVVLYADVPAVRSAIRYAVDRDVVVVAAAGNLHGDGDPRPYPAAYAGVIGVGAITADGGLADFSQVGPYVDVVAPGSDVIAAVPGRGHRRTAGTSYATPFVAATAALLRQYRPELTAGQVADRIAATADPARGAGPGSGYGAGVLNPYRAVSETPPGRPVTPTVLSGDDPAGPGLAAREVRRSAARDRALLVAGSVSAVVVLAVLLALVLPRGTRRGWRPADPD